MKGENLVSKAFLAKRPLNVQSLFEDIPLGLVSGRDIVEAARRKKALVLGVNARSPLVIKGVLRAVKGLRGAVFLEIVKSENAYCGCTFDNTPDYALKYSEELRHGVVFALHVDRYDIMSRMDLLKTPGHLQEIIGKGWTSVALDASHCSDWENLCHTRDAAMSVPPYLGLQVEAGKGNSVQEVCTPEEARYVVGGLNAWGIFPDMLAISRKDLPGLHEAYPGFPQGVDFQATASVAEVLRPYGVEIAQRGISGIFFPKVAHFHECGIRKGSVATLWQNILFGLRMDPDTGNAVVENGSYIKEAHRGIPEDLWQSMVSWADDKGYSRQSGDYKRASKPFHEAMMDLPREIHHRIVDEVEFWVERLIKAFNAEGLGDVVEHVVGERQDWNAAPRGVVVGDRKEFSPLNAPDRLRGLSGDFDE